MLHLLIAGLLLALSLGGAVAAPVVVLQVQGAIGPASADYVLRGLERARREGAGLLVLELDTPGGLDSSMRQIVQAVLASPVPVASFVSPSGSRAASAGTYILLASHVAAMAPATALGAATPVSIGMPVLPGSGEPPGNGQAVARDPMSDKQVNDAAALIRGLAERHRRNAVWAESAVRQGASLNASEALRESVIDVLARDLPDLLDQIDGRRVHMADGERSLRTRGEPVLVRAPDWRHRLLGVIANPNLALILLMIGIYGLLFEFMSPGMVLPGTLGGICLLLGLFALQVLPTEVAAAALILLGLALVAAEFVVPSVGVLGGGGAVSLIAGAVLLYDSDAPAMGVPWPLLLGSGLGLVMAVLVTGGLALRSRRRPVLGGVEELIGLCIAVQQADASGEAWAVVRGERWSLHGSTRLQAGQRVRVTAVVGLALQVEPLAEGPAKGFKENPA